MSPRLILTLWRERWGKADNHALKVPYIEGKLNQWSDRFVTSPVWSLPGMAALTTLACVLFFLLTLSVQLSLDSQIALSVFIGALALLMRRYTGTFVTLMLIGLSLLASTRYLCWRLTATLGQDFNWNFILGFCLCVAELHLFLLTVFRWIPVIWPLKLPFAPLPQDAHDWPTVDIFIPCHDQSHASILAATRAAQALDWPHKKIHVYLLDDAHREEIHALSTDMGVIYVTHPDHADGKAGAINRALADTRGQLIAIFEGGNAPDKDFLQQCVGWFVQDLKLGMLQTPHHFLSPPPPAYCAKILDVSTVGSACALIRRSMLEEAGGIESAPVAPHTHTAQNLQALGYTHAYMGFEEQGADADRIDTLDLAQNRPSTPNVFRVNDPLLATSILWKLRLASFLSMLEFYGIVPRLIFLAAPVAYLLADVTLVQTSGELFLAYALPHLMHTLIAQARLEGRKRFSVWTTAHETALAWYLWVRTALTFVRTECERCIKPSRTNTSEKAAPFGWRMALPFACVLVLNLAGFVVGCVQLPFLKPPAQVASIFYLMWAAYNLLSLSTTLAIAEEARHIRLQMRVQLRIRAMIKLPTGRSVICRTENFPATALELRLPTPIVLEAGLPVSLSIFRGYQEYSFPVRVISQQDMILRVSVDKDALPDYCALGIAAHSRGEDWPKWLPDRDADHPLPPWVIKSVAALHAQVSVMGSRLGNWIQKWKRKK